MGGKQDDLLFGKGGYQLEDLALAHRVQARGRFIQDNQRSIVIEQPGQRQPLPLSPGQIGYAAESRSHHGVDTIWQRIHRLPQTGQAQRLSNALLLPWSALTLHRYILPNAEVEVRGILEEDGFCNGFEGDLLASRARRVQRTRGRRNEPGEQLDERALACPVGAHDSSKARCEVARNVNQRCFLVLRVRIADLAQTDGRESLASHPDGDWREAYRVLLLERLRKEVEEGGRVMERRDQGSRGVDQRLDHAR